MYWPIQSASRYKQRIHPNVAVAFEVTESRPLTWYLQIKMIIVCMQPCVGLLQSTFPRRCTRKARREVFLVMLVHLTTLIHSLLLPPLTQYYLIINLCLKNMPRLLIGVY